MSFLSLLFHARAQFNARTTPLVVKRRGPLLREAMICVNVQRDLLPGGALATPNGQDVAGRGDARPRRARGLLIGRRLQ